MNLNAKLAFPLYALALVISLVPVSPASIGTTPEPSTDRVKRRSYYSPLSTNRRNTVSIYEASGAFKPSTYTVPRPYYIPVYGLQNGRPLIFYPPQPLYVNPGMPQDNPSIQSYGGFTGYVPPKESPHFTGGDSYLPPKTPPRLGGDDDDISVDDPNAPIWGMSGGGIVQMPLRGDQDKGSSLAPTRAPMTRSTSPPLVHGAPSSGQSGTVGPVQRPQTTRRPTLRTTTAAPSTIGPSNCVWAIISCCTAGNPTEAPQQCFEQRGCPGPFWGSKPCENDYAKAAISAAMNYYNQNG